MSFHNDRRICSTKAKGCGAIPVQTSVGLGPGGLSLNSLRITGTASSRGRFRILCVGLFVSKGRILRVSGLGFVYVFSNRSVLGDIHSSLNLWNSGVRAIGLDGRCHFRSFRPIARLGLSLSGLGNDSVLRMSSLLRSRKRISIRASLSGGIRTTLTTHYVNHPVRCLGKLPTGSFIGIYRGMRGFLLS